MKSILAFALIVLCSVAMATSPRSRGNCPQNRGFDPRDFGHHQQRDFDRPREIETTTEIRRGPFGRVRKSETTRTIR